MPLEDHIRRVEQAIAQLEPVAHLSGRILGELMKSTPPPADLGKVRGYLGSARERLKQGGPETAQPFLRQAEDALRAVRQWLAVGDLGISPYVLRRFLEANRADPPLQQALIRYFLTKQPHADNDQDKLDYLLSNYFGPGSAGESSPRLAHRQELRGALEELCAGASSKQLSPPAEVMVHELESLIARIEDFTEFNQLVGARIVERARALKSSLGEEFYHPQVLSAVVRFNVNFRRHFETLIQQQLELVRQETRRRFEEAWELVRAIEDAYEKLWLPQAQRAVSAVFAGGAAEATSPVGRPLELLGERPPLDRLVRHGEGSQKENELRGIINRIARFLEKLSPEQAQAEKVVLPLRQAKLELAPWEREAFVATATAPESARTIQYALAVVAWLEEELARYKQTRDERYLWKTHFDHLSYAVVRVVDLLKAIQELVHEGAPQAEVAWFEPLLRTVLRLATTLNRIAPVFEAPRAA